MALITLGGNAFSRRAAGIISTGSVALSFAAAVVCFATMLTRSPDDRSEVSTAWTWLSAGNFRFGLSILVDPLSVFMMLIVSGVGGLIVLYSIGYMHDDDEERRYFAYMALFVFSMLMLVEGGNLLLLLVGWGLVGLSSYLLIGFWHERPSAVAAAKKAFVMNAVGDATFVLALILLISKTGTLDYAAVFSAAPGLSQTVLILVALGLLGGAVAKSAQLPLHTWLPDAMEGPTPVSALIHAATMVTAGVYLIARTSPLFQLAPSVQDTAAVLGAVTLVFAGLVALVQVDIKRVIAYSTMSQIGYMFLGVGIGAYADGMFHLLTHAFFKALLFLAAGVIIHALTDEQDIRRMGGLRKLMPYTYAVFLVGALSLVGIPPFAGFFSKDPIIASALARGGWLGYLTFAFAIVGTLLTGLYTFRLVFRVFHGEPDPVRRQDVRQAPRRGAARDADPGRRARRSGRCWSAGCRCRAAGRPSRTGSTRSCRRSSTRRTRRRRSRASSPSPWAWSASPSPGGSTSRGVGRRRPPRLRSSTSSGSTSSTTPSSTSRRWRRRRRSTRSSKARSSAAR